MAEKSAKGVESPGTAIPTMSVKVKIKPRQAKRGMRQESRKDKR